MYYIVNYISSFPLERAFIWWRSLFNNKMRGDYFQSKLSGRLCNFTLSTLYFHGCHTSISRVIRMALCKYYWPETGHRNCPRECWMTSFSVHTFSVFVVLVTSTSWSQWMGDERMARDCCTNEGEGMTSNILAILSVLKLDRRGVANGGTIR